MMLLSWISRLSLMPGLSLLLLVAGGVACSSPDVSGPTTTDLTQLPWNLTLSAHAITMDTAGPYNTLQLTAVPRTIDGAALVGGSVPTFTSSDSSVRVSATGVLTARAPRTGVQVIATVVHQGVRVSDTAFVNVTAVTNPPMFQQLQLQLQLGDDSTMYPRLSLGGFYGAPITKTLRVGAQDGGGTQIANSLVALRVSDVLQAFLGGTGATSANETTTASTITVSSQEASRIGVPFTVYASATVYGVTLEDSLHLMIVDPIAVGYTVKKSILSGSGTSAFTLLPQSTLTTRVGGWVWWANEMTSADSLDVVFDDPTAASPDLAVAPFFGFADGGIGENIPAFPGGDFNISGFSLICSRQFLQAGSYHWTSPRTGLSGTVIVQ